MIFLVIDRGKLYPRKNSTRLVSLIFHLVEGSSKEVYDRTGKRTLRFFSLFRIFLKEKSIRRYCTDIQSEISRYARFTCLFY